jgi:hypothetical protein
MHQLCTTTTTTPTRYKETFMADAEKSALAEQRAEKKAARRAAFIQEVADAVLAAIGADGCYLLAQAEADRLKRAADKAAYEESLLPGPTPKPWFLRRD